MSVGFFRKIGATGAALLIALACLLVMGMFILDDRADDRALAQETVDNQYLNCLRGNELRRGQIESEKEPNVPVDLSVLPSVHRAPEWFQEVVRELHEVSTAAAVAPIDPESRTGRRIARLESQIRDCEGEWAGHTPGLRLPHDQTNASQ